MLEADLQREVVKHAQGLGWKVAAFRPAKTTRGNWVTAMQGDTGYPDLTCVRGERLIFAELKQDKNYPSPHQREWLDALRLTGAEVFVWKEQHWPREIDRVLR